MGLENAYNILGLSNAATVADIKKAYRAKAMLLHPDRNPSPEAHQQFVALTEAYELLLDARSGNFRQFVSTFDQAERAAHARREAAKRKAREYARMRYEEFEQSEEGRVLRSLNTLLNHFMSAVLVFVAIGLPLLLIVSYPIIGIILSIPFGWFIGWPLLKFIRKYVSLSDFLEASLHLGTKLTTYFVVLTIINVYLFLAIGFQTLLPLTVLYLILIVPMVLFYISTYLVRWKTKQVRFIVSFGLVPFMCNMLFLVNDVFSSSARVEIYKFDQEISGSYRTSAIHLEGDAYSEYKGIRVFLNEEEMRYNNYVIYQFEDGLFGVPVMKEYHFIHQ